MFESFLITGRETLEAALVVGITLAYLEKTNNSQYTKTVWIAILTATITSLFAAFLFSFFSEGLAESIEPIFEGVTMLLGAVLLTTMILWMLKQRNVAKNLENNIGKHLTKTPLATHAGIFLMIFLAILREGVETILFLNAIRYASEISLLFGVLGVGSALLVGWFFFYGSKKTSLKHVFSISSVLLVLFAAGLFAHGIHELEDASILLQTPQAYDITTLLSEQSILGSFAKGLFGYNANPSILELFIYLAYVLGIILFVQAQRKQSTVLV